MRNQRDEVVTAVMVVMMAVMMLFGVTLVHGEHGSGSGGHCMQHDHNYDNGNQQEHHSGQDADRNETRQ